MAAAYPQAPNQSGQPYSLYGPAFAAILTVVTIDKVLNNIVPLLAKGEFAINAQLADLATLDPGQLDQSRLMAAQMNMARWQLAAQLLSNFASGVASGLKNTVQNVGR